VAWRGLINSSQFKSSGSSSQVKSSQVESSGLIAYARASHLISSSQVESSGLIAYARASDVSFCAKSTFGRSSIARLARLARRCSRKRSRSGSICLGAETARSSEVREARRWAREGWAAGAASMTSKRPHLQHIHSRAYGATLISVPRCKAHTQPWIRSNVRQRTSACSE
jgi:hypothetical protein